MTDLLLDHRPVHLAVSGLTHPGRQRSENQDHFLVAELGSAADPARVLLTPRNGESPPSALPPFPLPPRGALLLVADGMGGAAAGSIASKMAAGWIYEDLVARWVEERESSPRRFMTCLRDAVAATNSLVHQQAARYAQYRGMGTTVTAAGVLGDLLYLVQVGDSRAYLVRLGVATQLTRDQSLVQELIDAGTITPAEAETNAHRNVILQAIGVAEEVSSDATFQQLRRGDVLVLCSDGLSRTVQPEEIASVIGDPEIADPCGHLVALANDRGGPDNVTVLVARFDGSGLEPPRPSDSVERRRFPLDV